MRFNLKDIIGLVKGNFEVKKAVKPNAKKTITGIIGITTETNLQPILKEKGIEIPPGVITTLVTIIIHNILSWWKHRK